MGRSAASWWPPSPASAGKRRRYPPEINDLRRRVAQLRRFFRFPAGAEPTPKHRAASLASPALGCPGRVCVPGSPPLYPLLALMP